MAYLYQTVSGASIWNAPTTLASAAARAVSLWAKYPDAEVERIQQVGSHARRYWRWRKGKWSLAFHTDPTPDDLARWSRY